MKSIISLHGKEKANINDETIQNVNKKGNLYLHDSNTFHIHEDKFFNLTELTWETLWCNNSLIKDLDENLFSNLTKLKGLVFL